MRAAVYRRYGPPEVVRIEDVPKPSPQAGDLLVKVCATTVAAGDWRMRRADPAAARVYNGLFRPTRHRILGMELSGVIEATGGDVSRFAAGDAVIVATDIGFGAHAEYVCVPEDGTVAAKPETMSFEEAAAVCFGGLGALGYINGSSVRAGDRVLINGASGATGSSAAQLAVALGAEVTGVCSGRNLDLVRSLGAAHVIDYTEEDFTRGGPRYDLIFDAVGKTSRTRTRSALAPGGTFATVMKGGASPKERAAGLAYLVELIEAGKFRPVIDRVYPLDQIVEAHHLAESGHKVGSIVVTF